MGLITGEAEQALRVAVGLGTYWRLRGYRSEGRAWLQQVLAAAGDPPAGLRPLGLLALSELEYNDGDRAMARRHADESVAGGWLIRPCRARRVSAPARQGCQGARRSRAGAGELRRSAPAGPCSRHRRHGGSALAGLGDLARERGALDDARVLYLDALASYQRAGDPHATGNVLLNLGQVAREQGATDDAAVRYRDALATFEALRDVTCGSEAIAGLAELRRHEAIARNDVAPLRDAEELQARALRQRAGIGQRGAMVDSFEALARLAAAQGDPRRATTLLGFADALPRPPRQRSHPRLRTPMGALPPRRPPARPHRRPCRVAGRASDVRRPGCRLRPDRLVAYARCLTPRNRFSTVASSPSVAIVADRTKEQG